MLTLIPDIEAFLTAHGMSETAFGTEALNDKNFITDLREGRSPSLRTVARVQRFMSSYPNHHQQAAA